MKAPISPGCHLRGESENGKMRASDIGENDLFLIEFSGFFSVNFFCVYVFLFVFVVFFFNRKGNISRNIKNKIVSNEAS